MAQHIAEILLQASDGQWTKIDSYGPVQSPLQPGGESWFGWKVGTASYACRFSSVIAVKL